MSSHFYVKQSQKDNRSAWGVSQFKFLTLIPVTALQFSSLKGAFNLLKVSFEVLHFVLYFRNIHVRPGHDQERPMNRLADNFLFII